MVGAELMIWERERERERERESEREQSSGCKEQY